MMCVSMYIPAFLLVHNDFLLALLPWQRFKFERDPSNTF